MPHAEKNLFLPGLLHVEGQVLPVIPRDEVKSSSRANGLWEEHGEELRRGSNRMSSHRRRSVQYPTSAVT